MNSTSLVSDIIAWLEWQKYCGLEYLDEYTYDSILSFCEYYVQNVDEIESELEMLERQCQDATDALLQERKERKKMEARLQQLRQDTKVAKPLK